jgi:hypothetical protein
VVTKIQFFFYLGVEIGSRSLTCINIDCKAHNAVNLKQNPGDLINFGHGWGLIGLDSGQQDGEAA